MSKIDLIKDIRHPEDLQIVSHKVNIPAKGSFSDSHGSSNHPIKSKRAGYVINISQVPMVYEGEAVFNFTTERQEDE